MKKTKNEELPSTEDKKVIIGNSTKTYAGIRDWPIQNFILPYIIEQMEQGKSNKNNQMFLSPKGNLVDPRNANATLKRILKNKLNITDITTHSLRHTYGTRCIEAGMRAVALQRLMGHTSIDITLDTYTSVFNKYKQSEMNKVNEYYLNNNLLPKNLLNSTKDGMDYNDRNEDLER